MIVNPNMCKIEQLKCRKNNDIENDILNSSQADILLLQEVGRPKTRERWKKLHTAALQDNRIRAITYVRHHYAAQHSIELLSPETTADRVVITINGIKLINIYNDTFNPQTAQNSALSSLINSTTTNHVQKTK